MQNQYRFLVIVQAVFCMVMTLFCFHTIVQSMLWIRIARYDHFSSRPTLVSLGAVLFATLFVYAMAAWQMVKFRLVTRRAVWAVVPFGVFVGVLGCAGYAQVRRDAKDTDLLFAAEWGNAQAVANLLHQGANIETRNSSGATPLMRAAEYGQTQAVGTLLDRGANIAARDERGETAVMTAADQGQAETLNFLLSHGANPDTADVDGITPLMWAAAFANHQTVETLLRNGAYVNAVDRQGKTALMMAAGDREELGSRGNAFSARVLLAFGANARLADRHGNTALTAARKSGKPELISLLAPDVSTRALPFAGSDADEEKSTANWP